MTNGKECENAVKYALEVPFGPPSADNVVANPPYHRLDIEPLTVPHGITTKGMLAKPSDRSSIRPPI